MKNIFKILLITVAALWEGACYSEGTKIACNPVLPPGLAMHSFQFSDIEKRAKDLATKPYNRDDAGVPDFLSRLDYDQYRDIRFKVEKSLWKDEGLPFQLQLFHRGFMFKDRVNLNIIDQGGSTRLAYSPELFDFGNNAVPAQLPADLGFSGLRIHHPLRRDDVFDEITVFLGASYFRAVGLGQIYGLSARGLAIDTGLAKAEEFPLFREFWIEKPAKTSSALTVYALLDSPSVTGAYRFVLHPGLNLTIDVTSHVYFRRVVERLGLATLTSMYFHGENSSRHVDDFRPEVHDSDGLLLARSNGEWVWRPLNNPKLLRVSVFKENKPTGFGLWNRDRNFDHYQDLEARYNDRPSLWIEAVGDWGGGSVYLIEIPSDAEKYDNVVAFWVPDFQTGEGKDYSFSYRMHFTKVEVHDTQLAYVKATRTGSLPTESLNIDAQRKFVVEFASPLLESLSEKAKIEADVSASSGKISNVVVQKNYITGEWRLSFEVAPEKDRDPVELRALLKSDDKQISETWVYQWNIK